MTDFCKNCDNILEMTRTLPNVNPDNSKELLNTATPDELSETDTSDFPAEVDSAGGEGGQDADKSDAESDVDSEERDDELENFYEGVLTAVENEDPLTNDQLANIDIKKMIKAEYYQSLKSKSAIKKKILAMIEDMGNSDENTSFYLSCTNCGYYRALDPGFHILSKNPEGVPSIHDYSDESKIRNNIHTGIYPRTREFKCQNTKCASNTKGTPTEACMIREGDTYKMIYVCTTCLDIKRL